MLRQILGVIEGANFVSVDLESLHKILQHPIRRRIVLALNEKKELTYMDLMNITEVGNTGKLNYHLKILEDLIEKNGKYHLTEKGQLASQMLQRFPEKKAQSTSLHGGDAVLIGFVGFLVAIVNPGFWGFFLIPLLGWGIVYLAPIYALMVPGGLMWWLTTRRIRSHDAYDLFKPPLVTFVSFVLLLIIMILLNFRVTITAPLTDSNHAEIAQPTFSSFIIAGMIFPFLGIGISELISRIIEKRKLS